MKELKQRPIGSVVADNYRTARIFKMHKLDFCCQGNRSIEEACQHKGVDLDAFLNELEQVMEEPVMSSGDYANWPLDKLVDHIEKKHHRYVELSSREIRPYLDKLCRVHGERHPELFEITGTFSASLSALAQHMKKEELILFPYIRKLELARKSRQTMETSHFGSVDNPIAMMMDDHEVEGERFRTIAALTNDYQPPADGCSTYRVTFSLLKEFEDDLHLHIHLENNILFPATKALDQELRAQVV